MKFPSPLGLGAGDVGQPLFPCVLWGGLLSPLQCSAGMKDTEMASTTGFFGFLGAAYQLGHPRNTPGHQRRVKIT